ncbi:unnamed protein product [Sphagnum jensenii]|uniref:Uncharacterized protein n=1 Tax=Sphagnum jensenii TaxID=128206 RepID=A0ABP0WV68_9BRYO
MVHMRSRGLGVSSWLLIVITILVVLQLSTMVGVSGARISRQFHGNCLKHQNDLFECLVVRSLVVPTPPVPINSFPAPPTAEPPF